MACVFFIAWIGAIPGAFLVQSDLVLREFGGKHGLMPVPAPRTGVRFPSKGLSLYNEQSNRYFISPEDAIGRMR